MSQISGSREILKRINRYIDETEIENSIRYAMFTSEATAMFKNLDPAEAIFLAFNYGRAKGYRAAKKENK